MAVSVGELLAYLRLDSTAFDAGIRSAQTEMTGAAGSAERMEVATAGAGDALAGAGRMANVAASGSAKLRAAQLSAVAATERYNAVLADEDASLARLASAEAAVIRANERVAASTPVAPMQAMRTETAASSATMTRAGGAFGGFAKTAAGLGVALGGFALAMKAVDIVKQGAQFQRSMLLVQTQAGASAAEVKSFSTAVLAMSGQVATAPDKLANSLYHAYSVGLRGAQALDAIKIAAEGAKVGNADLEQTTNALTAAVASGIPGVRNMQQAMGALNTIVGAGDMNLEQLNEALGSGILVVAKQFGVTLTDVGAALATFGDNNIRGAQAATTLRVAINAMAKPVAGGAEQLAKLGLSATALADDMQHGGLNQALHDLKDHLNAAGITGSKVGDVLLTAFGKKAGPGVSVLVDQLSRFDQKTAEIEKGAGSFGDRWKATTQTASFAFQKLGAEIESGGIILTGKLMPALSSAATWLGTTLPHAIGSLINILEPAIHLVGAELVGAWTAVHAVAAPIVGVLASVAHYLEDDTSAGHRAVTVLLEMFVAFKSLQVAGMIFGALSPLVLRFANVLIGIPATLIRIAAGMKAVAAGETAMALGPFAVAVAAVGLALHYGGDKLNDYLERNNALAKVLPNISSEMNGWRDALQQSNGALTESIRLGIEKQLQDSGLAAKAAAAGISLDQLTHGVTGNDAAFKALIDTWKASGKPSGDTIVALGLMHGGFQSSAKSADELNTANSAATKTADRMAVSIANLADKVQKNAQVSAWAAIDQQKYGATAGPIIAGIDGIIGAVSVYSSTLHLHRQALNWVVDSSGNLVQTTGAVATAATTATTALQAQTLASQQLKTAQDLLNGVNESLETSTDAFSIAVGGLAKKQGLMGTSLDQTSVAGATNRQVLVGLIDAAKAQAQATADEAYAHSHKLGPALIEGNKQLKSNEDAIRAAATAAGLNKTQVDNLINSLGILSKVKADPQVNVNTAPAMSAIAVAQQTLDNIKQHKGIYLHLDSADYDYALEQAQLRLDALKSKTIYIDVQQRVLGSPIPHAAGGYGGPMFSAARTAYGMVNGPGTGTSDQAGIYKLSAREFVSTAASVARNAGALEAGNRGATLVAIDGLTRKLVASTARASMPVAASVPVSAPSGGGFDLSPLTHRLDAIERRLAEAPTLTAAANGPVYREAARAGARETQRIMRGR